MCFNALYVPVLDRANGDLGFIKPYWMQCNLFLATSVALAAGAAEKYGISRLRKSLVYCTLCYYSDYCKFVY